MRRATFLIIASFVFLSACTKQNVEPPVVTNPSVVSTHDAQGSSPSKKPSLPSGASAEPLPSLDAVAEAIKVSPESLNPEKNKSLDSEKIVTNLPTTPPELDPLTKEAMNPESGKDCALYEAEVLRQICYNSRGLSSKP